MVIAPLAAEVCTNAARNLETATSPARIGAAPSMSSVNGAARISPQHRCYRKPFFTYFYVFTNVSLASSLFNAVRMSLFDSLTIRAKFGLTCVQSGTSISQIRSRSPAASLEKP
jgi:hypothetical protein